MKSQTKKPWREWQWILLTLLTVCICSCKDDEDTQARPFDPSKEIRITGFTPEKGGAYQQLLISGENFGTDASIVTVRIGGQEAVVISVTGSHIYCYVPQKAYSGIIEVTIDDGDNIRTTSSEKAFAYTKEQIVGTLCGYRNTDDDQGWQTGSFTSCCGFNRDGRLAFDPQNPSHLYIVYDGYDYVQLIDLEKKNVSNAFNVSPLGLGNRVRSIDFTQASEKYGKTKGQYMVITFDNSNNGLNSKNVYLCERNTNGTFDDTSEMHLLASYKECNGAFVHPNGEIYFNSFEKGQVFRVDPDDYFANPVNWNPSVTSNPQIEQLFTIADPGWEFQTYIHPTGSFAYIVVINQHYILRTDYNTETKRFVTPYVVAGGYKSDGYSDNIGTSARMKKPHQGVFVKNEEYATGDQYDFYFADQLNYCIRKMTPDGVVSTYAGRGSTSVNADNNFWGSNDGTLRSTARFREVTGLAYDSTNKIFYIHDVGGRTIRTISMDAGEEESAESNE